MIVARIAMASLTGAEAELGKGFPHCCNCWNVKLEELLVEQLCILEVEVVLVLVDFVMDDSFVQTVPMGVGKQLCIQEVPHLLGKTQLV